MIGYVIAICLLLVFVYVIFLYNSIIRSKNETENALGSVDATLKKRYDLIPNLVEVVKQYMAYESNLLTEITRLRSSINDDMNFDSKLEVYKNINKELSSIMLNVENYPELKANKNFINLQASWNEIEEQILAARRFYNTSITDYNNSIKIFPANILTSIFGFQPMKVMEFDEVIKQNPTAKDLFK